MIAMVHLGNNGVMSDWQDHQVVLQTRRSVVLSRCHNFPHPWPAAGVNDRNIHADPGNVKARHSDATPRERFWVFGE
jgi:hypothetical protein